MAAKSMTKGAILGHIAEQTGLKRKQVSSVFDELAKMMPKELKRGSGLFALAGLVKFKTIRKPATPGGGMKPNPFKPGEMMEIKAKPARTIVKCLPLKALKEMV